MKWGKVSLEFLWASANPGLGNPTLMAAIALAESAGDDKAENSIGACGLWQIHPYEEGCLNPYINAKKAGRKLREQGLTAWETYTNGSYKQFLGGSSPPVRGNIDPGGRFHKAGLEQFLPPPFGPLIPGLPSPKELLEGHIPNPLGPIKNAFSAGEKFFKILAFFFTKDSWIRIGKVLLGLFLLIVGVLGMANIGQSEVIKTTVKAGEVGAIGKGLVK